jgi:predicted methyltransferase
MYRPINTTEWKVEAISLCLKNHAVQREDDNYRLVTNIGNTDEDIFILDIKEYLENLMTEVKTQKAADDISKIRLGTPYAWTDEKEFQFLKEPGLLTIRIGNGLSATKEYGVYDNVGFG